MVKLVPFLVFFGLFLFNKRRVGHFFTLSNYILLLYSFSTLSFFFYSLFNTSIYWNFQSLLLIVVPTFLLILPLSRVEIQMRRSGFCFSELNKKRFTVLSWGLIVLSIYSIFFFSRGLLRVFSVDIVALRQGYGSLYEGGTIWSKAACLGAYLSPVAMFLFYYNLIKKQLPRYITMLLLLSSCSFVVYTLNVAGRDGIVIWVLNFVGLFFLFYHAANRKDRRFICRILMWSLVLVLPLFLFISSARFSQSSGGVSRTVISYAGQSLGNLSQNVDAYERSGYGATGANGLFELYYKAVNMLLGESRGGRYNRFDNADEYFRYMDSMGFSTFAFSYYVGSLYPIHTSIWGLAAFVGVLFAVFSFYLKEKGAELQTKYLICAFSWYTILISGLFYFYYGTYIGNFFLLITLLIPLLL